VRNQVVLGVDNYSIALSSGVMSDIHGICAGNPAISDIFSSWNCNQQPSANRLGFAVFTAMDHQGVQATDGCGRAWGRVGPPGR
jgi:hypothetical protein